MEEQAQALLATLKKSSASIDQKITLLNKVKSDIKHLRVPEAAQPTIFECLKVAISAQTSPTLVSTGLSTLPHFIKRLSLQEQTTIITAQIPKFLPILLERLGDQRESHRNTASQSIADLWQYNHVEVEKTIREGALAGHNARAKEMGMMWIVKMNRENALQFKSFVPYLVACLEDADGMVRETAKSVIVELFSNTPDRAKADLQKQMAAKDVRKTIVAFIVAQLGMGHSVDMDMGASITSAPGAHHLPEPAFGESAMAEHSEAQLEPLYVQSQRDLEDMFREMLPHFEGRESEHNWGPRDKSITKIRRLLVGNAPSEYHQVFVADIKSVMDGILKVSNSLRTTHSSNGCQLVQELAKVLGPSLDPMVDLVLQTFIKMSANTKPIAANNGSSTADILLSSVSYNKRLMEHMWFSFQDKNVQVRTCASGWLKTLITKHARSKAQIEHSGGLDLADKCLRKGLADANPKVREGTRATYWAFAQIWHAQADSIMDSLDPKSKQLLEKDAHNPNASSLASSMSSTKSVAAPQGKAGAFNGRQSVRDAIAAQKRAMAAKTERPASAQSMASISSDIAPVRSAAAPRAPGSRPPGSRPPASGPGSTATQPPRTAGHTASSSGSGSLMAAPVRRPGRRPEIARPATADPYATRKTVPVATPTMSPSSSPSKTKTTVPAKATMKTPAPTRPKTPVAHSSVRSKSRLGESSLPRPSPKSKTTSTGSPMASPRQSNFSHVDIPYSQPPDDEATQIPVSRRRQVMSEDLSSMDTSLTFEDVDNFTMVGIPSLSNIRSQPFEDRLASQERPVSRDRPGSGHSQAQTLPVRSSPSKVTGMQNHANSPLSRLRSPVVNRSPRPVSSQGQLRNNDAEHPIVQIYEDPPSDEEIRDNAVEEDVMSPVLEELPLNERALDQVASPDRENEAFNTDLHANGQDVGLPSTPKQENRSHKKTLSTGSNIGISGTPNTTSKNADVFRSRRLIGSGIERIRSRTLDVHGFRRIQDLVKTGGDIWGDENERFGELLIALLEYLESPIDTHVHTSHIPQATKPSTPATSRGANLKIQVLSTIRAMLSLHKREAAPYLSQSLVAILKAKAQFDDASHVAAEMERSVEEIIKQSTNASESIDAVTLLLESISIARDSTDHHPSSPHSETSTASSDASSHITQNAAPKTSRTIVLSLSALSQLLTKAQMTGDQEPRLGALAVKYLDDSDADVRKADLEFCLSCYSMLSKDVFWKQFLKGAREMHVNLMMYYLARRKRV